MDAENHTPSERAKSLDDEWLTYAELGRRMNTSPEAARQLAHRRKWLKRRPDNEGPNAPVLVLVPHTVFERRRHTSAQPRPDGEQNPVHTPYADGVRDLALAMVEKERERTEEQRERGDRERDRADAAERARDAEHAARLEAERERDALRTRAEKAEAAAAKWAAEDNARRSAGLWTRVRAAIRGE